MEHICENCHAWTQFQVARSIGTCKISCQGKAIPIQMMAQGMGTNSMRLMTGTHFGCIHWKQREEE